MMARKILFKAAKRIERLGWKQGAYGTEDGPCCIAGATIHVARELENHECGMAARRRLEAHLGLALFGLPAWNDTPGRTQAEVIAALRGAAEELHDAS